MLLIDAASKIRPNLLLPDRLLKPPCFDCNNLAGYEKYSDNEKSAIKHHMLRWIKPQTAYDRHIG